MTFPTTDRTAGAPGVAPRLSFRERDLLMTYLVRVPAVFLKAVGLLDEGHFTAPEEAGHRLIWASLVALHAELGAPAGPELIEAATYGRLEAAAGAPGLVGRSGEADVVAAELAFFFAWAWEVNLDRLPETHGLGLLQRFLDEREVVDPWLKTARELAAGHVVPADVPDLVKGLVHRSERVRAVAAEPVGDLLPSAWEAADVYEARPTAVDFFDKMVGGGLAARQVYGLLGALSSGKTRLAMQLSIAVAKQELSRAREDAAYVPGHVYYVGYEQPKYEVRRLAISAAANIPLARVNPAKPGWYEGLSTARDKATLQAYERAAQMTLGERERFDTEAAPLSSLWHVVDMSGTDPRAAKAGQGGIEEIAAYLEGQRRRGDTRVALVVIDYALLMARRYCLAKGLDVTKAMRMRINMAGDEARMLLGGRFDCPVLLLHQLSGEANGRSPGARVGHSDAAEGKLFAENLTYCLELGVKDEEANCVTLRASKCRLSATPPEPRLLTYTEACRFDPADHRFCVDPTSRRIVPREVMDTVAVAPRTAAADDGADDGPGDAPPPRAEGTPVPPTAAALGGALGGPDVRRYGDGYAQGS
jgi:hypothetical protein